MNTEALHRRGPSSSSSALTQVCDRCRFKKIKCDGQRPCSNCRNSSFPCEAKARLARNATPRSYVQYLEARVKHLEIEHRRGRTSPHAGTSRSSPYGDRTPYAAASSGAASTITPSNPVKDLSNVKGLGTHVIDEDGFSRYMGPSSGVAFATRVLHDLMTEEQQNDPRINMLFTLDDFNRNRTLEQMDQLLWSVVPTSLPDRRETDMVLDRFFCFGQRLFPVLHKQTFMNAVDELYTMDTIDVEYFEVLAQFYFALSIGHAYMNDGTEKERTGRQMHAIETGVRCHLSTFHKRRDGLTRLQTLALHSYSLTLLRQRSEALRISSMANIKALECGLHHDGYRGIGNPLEQQMRRRVFWSVFMLHLYLTSLAGLPRLLHETDITIAEPDNIDDEQLTTTEVLHAPPGRTKIHRFVSTCRLVRILSRCLDVIYTTNKRKPASTKIEHMSRLCCDHLLDQLDFNFDEVPSDIPDVDVENPEQVAILTSYANEQLLFYYIRWLIYRPGLAIDRKDPFFSTCLQMCTEAAKSLIKTMHKYLPVAAHIKANPAAHPATIFIVALTPLYRAYYAGGTIFRQNFNASGDHQSVLLAVDILTQIAWDSADECRRELLRALMVQTFSGSQPQAVQASIDPQLGGTSPPVQWIPYSQSAGTHSSIQASTPTADVQMDYQRQRLEQMVAQEDLRNFVHEAFSPGLGDIWDDQEYQSPY